MKKDASQGPSAIGLRFEVFRRAAQNRDWIDWEHRLDGKLYFELITTALQLPDFSLWAKKHVWALHEAISLLQYVDPEELYPRLQRLYYKRDLKLPLTEYENVAFSDLVAFTAKITKIYQDAHDCHLVGTLETICGWKDNSRVLIKPRVFLEWAQEYGHTIPNELQHLLSQDALAQKQKPEETSPKSDPRRDPSIETPKGTTWRNIRLVIRNNDYTETLEVTGPKKHLGNFNPMELGFRGHGKSFGTMWTMLVLFAQGGGEIKAAKSSQEMKPTILRLRKLLHSIFPGIEGDPVPWNYKERCWQTAFSVKFSKYAEAD